MIGEFEYDSIFNDPENPLPYPQVTWPLFVAFLILMSILIMNLLVGLAVDDIKAVQEQAVLKRLGMRRSWCWTWRTSSRTSCEGCRPRASRSSTPTTATPPCSACSQTRRCCAPSSAPRPWRG